MINPVRIATNWYARLIRLYPPEFQCDFGEELQIVFHSMVKEADQKGGALPLAGVFLQEFHDLPGNILHEYLASLRKAFKQDRLPGRISPALTAGRGAIGFGLGFGLLIIFRWLFDPQNDIIFTNLGANLLRETLLFGLMAAMGWVMVGCSVFRPSVIKRLAVTSLLLGAIGGLLSTVFTAFSFKFFNTQMQTSPSFGLLIQFIGALIIGAFFGAVFGFMGGQRTRLIRMAVCGSACFGVSSLISEEAFHLICHFVLLSWSWKLEFWVVPQAASAVIEGLIAGALLGWIVAREKPPKPARRAAVSATGSNLSILEDGEII